MNASTENPSRPSPFKSGVGKTEKPLEGSRPMGFGRDARLANSGQNTLTTSPRVDGVLPRQVSAEVSLDVPRPATGKTGKVRFRL
jgi:hypothetical protein